jgi:hypothetical protein
MTTRHNGGTVRDKLFEFVGKHPIWVILIFLAFTVIAAAGAQKLALKTDYKVMFDADNAQLIDYQTMEKVYSRNKNISFVIVPKDNNVFTAEHLSALKQLTKQSWQVPFSTRVDSITNFQYTRADGDDLIVEDLVTDPASLSPTQIAEIKKIALNEPLLVKKFISETGHVSVINVTVKLADIDPLAEQSEVTHYRVRKGDNRNIIFYFSEFISLAIFSINTIDALSLNNWPSSIYSQTVVSLFHPPCFLINSKSTRSRAANVESPLRKLWLLSSETKSK